MKFYENRFALLLFKQIREELEPGEKEELERLLATNKEQKALADQIQDQDHLKIWMKEIEQIDEREAIKKFWAKYQPTADAEVIKLPSRRLWYVAASIAILIVISTALYVFLDRNRSATDIVRSEDSRLIVGKAPGNDGAILKLSNGKELVLDSGMNGTIAQEGTAQIVKQGPELSYNSGESNSAGVLYNTLSTPRGKQFQLTLPDGSKVWLNAASSITFPTAFVGNERNVKIAGEVYFEIAHNKAKPFKVLANGVQVEVLGTHFNINAYEDEASIKTTLLEGAVKVSLLAGGGPGVKLKPEQQAQVSSGNAVKVMDDIDLESVVAWKNNLIIFNRSSIQEIMRQISRWYDVDIEYRGDISVPGIYGEIPRTVNLSEVLRILEINSRLKFELKGNVISVEQLKKV